MNLTSTLASRKARTKTSWQLRVRDRARCGNQIDRGVRLPAFLSPASPTPKINIAGSGSVIQSLASPVTAPNPEAGLPWPVCQSRPKLAVDPGSGSAAFFLKKIDCTHPLHSGRRRGKAGAHCEDFLSRSTNLNGVRRHGRCASSHHRQRLRPRNVHRQMEGALLLEVSDIREAKRCRMRA